ncbi:MAG TPA: hypothetical protein VGF44_07445 [Terriglobales bacterium]|jgi:hypothetical protein
MINKLIWRIFIGLSLLFIPNLVTAQIPSIAPAELVRRAVKNETADTRNDNYLFKADISKPQGSQTKLMVNTRDGMAGLIVRIDGKPLTADQQTSERARIERFINNPDELKKKQKQEAEDEDHTVRIVKALPDAFLYEYDGTMVGNSELGKAGDQLVRLKFKPNPDYEPPSRVEQVLTGLAGHLLIDANELHIAEIDGTLIDEVNFGWGIFGHLDKDGRFVVRQADVDHGHWELTYMKLSFTGKILLFKSLSIKSEETETGFQHVSPDLSFAQGVKLLEQNATKFTDSAVQARK